MTPRDLIGVPWVYGGRDPRKGLDCWGVVLALRPDLPDYADAPDVRTNAGELVRFMSEARSRLSVRRLPEPREGCVTLMGRHRYCHAGVYHQGRIVHSREGTGVVADRPEDLLALYPKMGWYEWA